MRCSTGRSCTKGLACAALSAVLVLTSACAVHDFHSRLESVAPGARWVLLPWMNRAEAPRVGERLEPVVMTLLLNRGITNCQLPPEPSLEDAIPILSDRDRFEWAKEWAEGQGFQYGVVGSVTEWRYKAGLEGEPAVGLSIRVIDLQTGDTVWSASGARTGWSRDSLSATAQRLLRKLLAGLVVPGANP